MVIESSGFSHRFIYAAIIFKLDNRLLNLPRPVNFIPLTWDHYHQPGRLKIYLNYSLWRGPVVVAISLATFFLSLFFCQRCDSSLCQKPASDFYKIPIEIVNKTLPIVAITLLSLVYWQSLLAAAYLTLLWHEKYRRFPPWLETWLQCKQLGLLSFSSLQLMLPTASSTRRSEIYLFLNMAYQQGMEQFDIYLMLVKYLISIIYKN